MPPPLLPSSSSIGTFATRSSSSLRPRCLSAIPTTSTTSTPPFASPCATTPSTPSWRPTPSSSAPSGPQRRFYSAGIERFGLTLPADYVPPTQPPSARRPEVRKSQLLRTYTHMLRTTPLALIFQHNNLTAVEWAAVRRELNKALRAVPVPQVAEGMPPPVDVAGNIQLQVIRTRMFSVAMKVVEFFDSATVAPGPKGKTYNHDLSRAAFAAMKGVSVDAAEIPETSTYAQLAPLMVGPLALVTFPAVSPAHLAAVLSILAPSQPKFPAPKRSKNPGYYDPLVQNALPKMLLVGGRVEGKVFDTDGVKWVGGIDGGLDSLRAQLVHMLQSAGMGLTTALEGASKSLWLTMESRRSVLEEEQNGGEKKEGEEKKEE